MSSNTERFLDIANQFTFAMLVTVNDGQPHSRPMSVADVDDEGNLWFLTDIDSGKLDEITENDRVNLALQDGQGRFMSVSGHAMTTRAPDVRERLWKPSFAVWFDQGKDDPSLIALQVRPDTAEYWDHSGVKGIEVMLELGRSAVTGDDPEFSKAVHDRIDL